MKLLSILLISTNVFAANYSNTNLIVKLKNSNSVKSLPSTNILSSKKLFGTMYLFKTNNLELLQKQLTNNPIIEYIQKDNIHEAQKEVKNNPPVSFNYKKLRSRPSDSPFHDPKSYKQWYLQNSKNHGIDLETVYLKGLISSKKEIIVAVVDSGVDYNHPDLKQKMWINGNEIPGDNIDNDNNGYVDDIHGINTLLRDSKGNATSDPNPGKSGHGTHVAGIIAAEQNNDIGITGISSNAKIMAIRTVPSSGDEKDSDVIEAFIYAAKNGAKIINCSFGKSIKDQAVSDAIDYIGKKFDVLVIVSAGNNGKKLEKKPKYPASFKNENKMTIGSSDLNGHRSSFSNYSQDKVDLFAPGGMVLSTFLNNKYKTLSGTSMASPVVSGVAAEIRSMYPNLTAKQVKTILNSSVVKNKRFRKKSISSGIINFYNALEAASKFTNN